MKYLFIFIYLAVNILLFFFNWELFTTYLEFDLGFGRFSTMPLLMLQIFGGLVLGAYMIWDRMKDLKREVTITNLNKQIVELQKNSEIQRLKGNIKDNEQAIKVIDNDSQIATQV